MKHILNFYIFFFLLILEIVSFTPGRWTPLDKYVLGLEKFGPKEEIVKNASGQIIYSAVYEYNDKGNLLKEIYKNSTGLVDGETKYFYENNKVTSEETFQNDLLKERKIYKYSNQGDLKELIVFGEDNKEIQRCKIINMKDEFITDAVIKWFALKETEYFNLKRDSSGDTWTQDILDDRKKSMGTIKFYFDEKGKLIKRENIQNSGRKSNEIKYDSEGRVIEFSFFLQDSNDWKLIKIHTLSY
jgi:antitoxin component YwqK of YwqJK toxin-antitoxin module